MRLAEDVAELGVIEQRPIQDGRNMTMLLGPVKKRTEDGASAEGGDAPPNGGADASACQRSRRAGSRARLHSLVRHAEDEDPFRRQEALSQDRARASSAARHAMTSHILEKKSAKRKRRLGRPVEVAKADEKRVRELLRG